MASKVIKHYTDVTDVLKDEGYTRRQLRRMSKRERLATIKDLGYTYDPQAAFGTNVQVTEHLPSKPTTTSTPTKPTQPTKEEVLAATKQTMEQSWAEKFATPPIEKKTLIVQEDMPYAPVAPIKRPAVAMEFGTSPPYTPTLYPKTDAPVFTADTDVFGQSQAEPGVTAPIPRTPQQQQAIIREEEMLEAQARQRASERGIIGKYRAAERWVAERTTHKFLKPVPEDMERIPVMSGLAPGTMASKFEKDMGIGLYEEVRDKPLSQAATFALGGGTGRLFKVVGWAKPFKDLSKTGKVVVSGIGATYAGSKGYEFYKSDRPGKVVSSTALELVLFTTGYGLGANTRFKGGTTEVEPQKPSTPRTGEIKPKDTSFIRPEKYNEFTVISKSGQESTITRKDLFKYRGVFTGKKASFRFGGTIEKVKPDRVTRLRRPVRQRAIIERTSRGITEYKPPRRLPVKKPPITIRDLTKPKQNIIRRPKRPSDVVPYRESKLPIRLTPKDIKPFETPKLPIEPMLRGGLPKEIVPYKEPRPPKPKPPQEIIPYKEPRPPKPKPPQEIIPYKEPRPPKPKPPQEIIPFEEPKPPEPKPPQEIIPYEEPKPPEPKPPKEIIPYEEPKPPEPKPDPIIRPIGEGGGRIPVPTLPGIPPIFNPTGGGGYGFRGFKFGKTRKTARKYTPSLSAIAFNIYGKKPTGRLSGLELRPLTGKSPTKKKTKKGKRLSGLELRPLTGKSPTKKKTKKGKRKPMFNININV